MQDICYLCGLSISCQKSDDHVIPKQLITRKQPKVKGFEYAGKLPSHAECNNRFGPEISFLISLLFDHNEGIKGICDGL